MAYGGQLTSEELLPDAAVSRGAGWAVSRSTASKMLLLSGNGDDDKEDVEEGEEGLKEGKAVKSSTTLVARMTLPAVVTSRRSVRTNTYCRPPSPAQGRVDSWWNSDAVSVLDATIMSTGYRQEAIITYKYSNAVV